MNPNGIDIGIVNNMPDPALEATEEQFLGLLRAAAGDLDVRVTMYALPGVQRSETGARRIRAYGSIETLWGRTLDGLIVTGTEPKATKLEEEPYWQDMARLVDWAEEHTASAIWSCLAAHAAVFHNDGIRRCRLPEKRFGVFEYDQPVGHELTAGIPLRVRMPHSRWNDLPENELRSAGYCVLTRSESVGVDAFVRQGKSLFVFFQGHPEYSADTLLLEYRRDIRRFLKHESDVYPAMPHGYFSDESQAQWTAFQVQALRSRGNGTLALPAEVSAGVPVGLWRPDAVRFYQNWLQYVAAEKARRLRTGSFVGTG